MGSFPSKCGKGTFLASTGIHTYNTLPDSPTTARWFLVNPKGSGRILSVINIDLISSILNDTPIDTVGRIILRRATFSGDISKMGSIVLGVAADGEVSAKGVLLTSTAGLSIVPDGVIWAFMLPHIIKFSQGGDHIHISPLQLGTFNLDISHGNDVELSEGQGLLLQQPDAGANNDPRRYITNFTWCER